MTMEFKPGWLYVKVLFLGFLNIGRWALNISYRCCKGDSMTVEKYWKKRIPQQVNVLM